MSIADEARQILEVCGRAAFLAFVRELEPDDYLEFGKALNRGEVFTPEQWEGIEFDLDMFTFRRSNAQWLDNLTDEQWREIERDILPILERHGRMRESG